MSNSISSAFSEGATVSTSKRQPSLLMRVLSYLSPYRRQFLFALFCMVLFGASDGVVPFLIKYVLDGVFSAHDKNLLTLLPIALILFAALRAFADFGQQFLMARIGHWIVRDIRNQFNRHILTLSPDFFLRKSAAQLLSGITSDVVLVRTLLTDSAAAVLRDIIRIVALLGAAIYLDPVLAGIAALAFPLGIYPVYRFGRKLRKLSKQGQDSIGTLSAMMSEAIVGHRVVKIFAREQKEAERFEAENEKLSRTFVRSEKFRALTGPINEVLATVAVSGVILYGGFSVMSGFRSQGDFIAFLVAVFLMYDPFKKLSRINGVVQQGLAGAQRLFEVLDAQASVRDPNQARALGSSNELSFEAVDFSYTPIGAADGSELAIDRPLALQDISVVIPEGKTIAIVGFSGAGKSTLVDLIPRFMDPSRGRIMLGGVDISSVTLAELRSRVAMVGQHTFLFNDTVFNNIAYGKPGATPEHVRAAAVAAFADSFIEQLPQKYETVLGEGGFSLSGGERQRIAIARALLKDAPLLILDEATASLDNRAEREVQGALDVLLKGRTAIVIAHRLSTVRNADLVLVMRDGRIVERGTHDSLLEAGGEYAKLHSLQFAEIPSDEAADAIEKMVQ
jgi:subfamily B ATP-binding cassette protein MsbA